MLPCSGKKSIVQFPIVYSSLPASKLLYDAIRPQNTMASPTAALSRTLKTIATTKIKEIEKQRRVYTNSKGIFLPSTSQTNSTQYERILSLLYAVDELQPANSSDDTHLTNIRSWLKNSQFDNSIPEVMLYQFEAKLRSKLDVQTTRLNLAALYFQPLTEWLGSTNMTKEYSPGQSDTLDDSFEIVENDRLQQLEDKFEAVVFTPLETSGDAIFNILTIPVS